MLAGVPSIVVGVFVWAVVVRNVFGAFSGLAGAIALALIMIPIITRTVEEMLRLVPDTYREAALGLGVSRAKTILFVVIPTAKGGIVTGIILAVARAGGETAPLVLTALGNQFFNFDLRQPMAALPLQIYIVRLVAVRGLAHQGVGQCAGADHRDRPPERADAAGDATAIVGEAPTPDRGAQALRRRG